MVIERKIRTAFQELKRVIYVRRLLNNRFSSRKKLRKIQIEKFRRLLIHAYRNVPFYYEKYKQVGINPYSIRIEKDILKIPVLTKEEVRANFPDRILAKGVDIKKCVIDHTSGSTSKPLKYAINYQNQAVRDAVHEYVRRIAGWRKNHLLINLRTPQDKNIDKLYGKKIIFKISPHSDIAVHMQIFDRLKPDFIVGEPSFLFKIAIELDKSNYLFKKPVKGIISTGELLIPVMKNRIEKSFNAKVFDSYGCGETVDIACECKRHNGMHEIMEHAYIEILKGNEPAKEMEPGKVLITDLDNYAMPFIRYDVGDVARRSYEFCSCGITSPLIKNIDGRVQDFLVSKDNKLIPPFVFTGIISPFCNEPLRSMIDQYQIVQDSQKNITLNIATQKKINKNTKEGLIKFTKQKLGNVKVMIKILKKIPQEKSGKFRCVISKVKKDLEFA